MTAPAAVSAYIAYNAAKYDSRAEVRAQNSAINKILDLMKVQAEEISELKGELHMLRKVALIRSEVGLLPIPPTTPVPVLPKKPPEQMADPFTLEDSVSVAP